MFGRNDIIRDPIDRYIVHNIQTSFQRNRKRVKLCHPSHLTAKSAADNTKKEVEKAIWKHAQRQKRRVLLF